MAEHSSGAFRTSIGGQALIEGILMRGPEKQAIVVRDKDGQLVEKVEELKLIKDRYPILGIPLIRGTVNFLAAMVSGVKALMYSADFYPEEEESQPSKFEQFGKAPQQRKAGKGYRGSGRAAGRGNVHFPLSGAANAAYRRNPPLFPRLPPVGPERGGGPVENRDLSGLSDSLLQAEGHLPGVPVSRSGA